MRQRLRRMLATLVLGSCLATATLPGALAVAQPSMQIRGQ